MPQTLAPPAPAPDPTPVRPSGSAPDPELRALAERHGLTVSGARPSLGEYTRQLWHRRHFITSFATAKLTAMYTTAKLGQLWQVITPLLNAGVYYLIFGVLIGTRKGVPDYIPYLVTGVFVFTFLQNSVMTGTRAISGNLGLVRALHFPRACLPISFCLAQLQQLLYSMAVLVVILLAFGQVPTWSWLLVLPALTLQFVFNTGLAMVMARLGSKTPDLAQLMPFIMRTWMYASGVMFSISLITQGKHLPPVVLVLLNGNPAAVYIDLMRFALIDSFTAHQLPPHVWAFAAGWAVVAGVAGYVYFWKAEEQYGRG
ncbi:ABC transporter permease [Streptomyces lunalinharesii]|uniref:Transport permease protein n=1 Tax=Streptomyces lunalinharesii TaxID=333384 RepID=A0ABP6ES89_9ACTN